MRGGSRSRVIHDLVYLNKRPIPSELLIVRLASRLTRKRNIFYVLKSLEVEKYVDSRPFYFK